MSLQGVLIDFDGITFVTDHDLRRSSFRRHFAARAGCGSSPDPAGQRPGGGLVRFAIHRRIGGNLRDLSHFAGFLGITQQDAGH